MIEPKPLFIERIKKLLGDEKDFKKFMEIIHTPPSNSIRANTIKISPSVLKKRLENKGWKIKTPFSEHEEIMVVENELMPGELGKAEEHLLGYYYIQEISSMMPILALNPKENELILDLCAAPGSKTSYIAAKMKNSGTIIANDKTLDRIKILIANLGKLSITNTIITRMDGIKLCNKLKKLNFKFDKILLDVPCSGEGTLRSSVKAFTMWNIHMIKKLSSLQKKLLLNAIPLLKKEGTLIYSTCTHAPEENEEVISFALEKVPSLKLEKIDLPLKTRKGIGEWEGKKFNKEVNKCVRIYPQDNNTEGFFIAKLKNEKN